MQGEFRCKAPSAAYSGDLAVVSAATSASLTNNVTGLQLLLDDNPRHYLPDAASFTPYNSIVTPVVAAATEITSTLTPSRTCWTSQQQDLINRHALCLSHLHSAAEEMAAVRQENSELRMINHRLFLLIQSYRKNFSLPQEGDDSNYGEAMATMAGFDLPNVFRRSCITENEVEQEVNSTESPTSVMESSDVDKMTIPKSISVRSAGFKKGLGWNQGEGNSGVAVEKGRAKAGSSSNAGKVYLRGGKNDEGPVELEVYNQGMFKTELCNKWQETGNCPYREHCQFAHGITELRPVIRHPRYKTEVCRMILAGDLCPYRHRCHFRHALTEQEKLMGMTPLQTRDRD